jgi:hypothetical protein
MTDNAAREAIDTTITRLSVDRLSGSRGPD